MKRAAKTVRRRDVELGGRGVLLDPPPPRSRMTWSPAHRLTLVVRDVDHRHAEALLQRADLAPHLVTQLGVEIGERLRPSGRAAPRR